jgi:hypothetical protein
MKGIKKLTVTVDMLRKALEQPTKIPGDWLVCVADPDLDHVEGAASFANGTLTLRGYCQGQFAHITRAMFVLDPDAAARDDSPPSEEVYPVLVQEVHEWKWN